MILINLILNNKKWFKYITHYNIIKVMEEFRKIDGYDNYSVSNFGVVINDKKWRILKQSNSNGYKVVGLDCKVHRVHILVAKAFIPNPDKKIDVDHIDNNRTNNNIENLRWSTRSENSCNAPISKSNTSGVKGLCWSKKKNKWQVEIMHKYKKYHLGYFTDKNEAIKARKLKANELFGEFTNECEKIVNLNIKIPKNTKLNININIEDDDEEYRMLEQELNDKINN